MIENVTFGSIGLWLIWAVAAYVAAGFGKGRLFPLQPARITVATARRAAPPRVGN